MKQLYQFIVLAIFISGNLYGTTLIAYKAGKPTAKTVVAKKGIESIGRSAAAVVTVSAGNWSTASNWSPSGIPGNTSVDVNHEMTWDGSRTFAGGSVYTINADVTDLPGGTAYNLAINGGAIVTLNANMTIEGTFNPTNTGTMIIVKSGYTLTVGSIMMGSSGSPMITVEDGAFLIINGNFTGSNDSDIIVDGTITVDGNFTTNGTASVTGNGTISATGTITSNNSSTIFGGTDDCTSGPCSTNNFCGYTNTITTSPVAICSGSTPSAITGTSNASSPVYLWEQSTNSATSGYTAAPGTNNAADYSPAALTQTTWFRRSVIASGCTARAVQLITIHSYPAAPSVTPASRCGTGTVTLNATASSETINWYAGATGGGILGTGGSFTTPSLSATTTYYVDADNSGCTSARSAVTATVNALPAPTISAGSTTTFCSGCSVTLTSSAGDDYNWSTGESTSSIVVSTGGSYSVTVTDANNCEGTSPAVVITVNTCANYIWTGAASSNWATASNWNKCTVPGVADDVTIPNVATAPIINAVANCRDLTIDAGASLTLNNGNTLNIYGNISNNGTYADDGTTVLTGPSAQGVTGAITFNNLTLDNAAGATLNNTTAVNGILTLTSGTLTSGGNLTVNLNTGAIDGAGSGAISGNIILSRTISNDYHFIASPLSGQTATDWDDDVTIATSGQYRNFFTYNETNTDTSMASGWEAVSSLSTPLTSMKGFALYFNGAASLDQTGSYTHNATYTSETLTNTVSSVGGTPNPASDGWNLVGNPYPSTLDWNAASGWTKTGLDNAIYFYDAVNDRYGSYVDGSGTNGGTQYIPSMQAFWVKVTSPGTGSLSVTNNARTINTNPTFWRTAAVSNVLKLTANNGEYSDETIIRFREDARETFDSQLDAYKIDNEDNTPNLYTELHHDQYSINSLPYDLKKITVPVKLKAGFTGAYTFTAEGTASFTLGDSLVFEDKLFGVKQDLRVNPSYTCSLTKGDTSGRFYINFKKAELTTGLIDPTITPSFMVKAVEDKINIKFFNESSTTATICIYNTLGEARFKAENADISNKEYSIQLSNASTGIYIVKVITNSQTSSNKVYLFR